MLDAEDLKAIRAIIREELERQAAGLLRKMRQHEEQDLDEEFEASLPIEEQKRRARERMKEQDEERRPHKIDQNKIEK